MTEVDRPALEARVALVSRFISQHAGGVEIASVGQRGDVHLQFTGMCMGCPYRPVTMAATVRPALMEIDGVTEVHAVGSRVSEHAERRMREDLEGYRTGIPAWITQT
jgi:Fe-S cluster biogenesis protein NfuA